MNRTQRNVAIGAAALAFLLFATGAMAGDDEGELPEPCKPPPVDKRAQPIPPKARPCQPEMLGETFIAPDPQFSGEDGDDKIFTEWMSYPDDPTPILKDAGLVPFDRPTVVVYWPSNVSPAEMELIIQDWAWVYGYRNTVFVTGFPEDRNYTAETWVNGSMTGQFALPDAYGVHYLDEMASRGVLPEGFTQGLIHWLYGKA